MSAQPADPIDLPLPEQLRRATLVSVRQAAKLFGCSPGTIYRLIRRRGVRVVMLGDELRIPLPELDAYVARNQDWADRLLPVAAE